MALSIRTKNILILTFICALYLALGTVVFVAIENNSIDETTTEKRDIERQRLKNDTMKKYNMSRDEYDALYEGIQAVWANYTASKWSYWGGFSFVIQMVTTIGYGNLTPLTAAGRVLCIFYALFGIPLCVLWLQVFGEEFLKGQRKLLIKLEACVRREQHEPRYMNEKCVAASFVLVFVLIFIGAGIQVHLEGWSFLEGVYCFFITFTTIGFGDFVPGGRVHTIMHIIRPFYILFGLVVMANIVNALVGCVDSAESLKHLFRCNRKEMDHEVEVKEDAKISMNNCFAAGNEEA